MPQNPQDSTNPGVVNVANQGDGLTVVNQTVKVGPSSNAGSLVNIAAQGDGLTTVDQPVTVGPSQSSASSKTSTSSPGQNVEPGVTNAGTFSPMSTNVETTTQNTVVGQIYGQGTPKNVFV